MRLKVLVLLSSAIIGSLTYWIYRYPEAFSYVSQSFITKEVHIDTASAHVESELRALLPQKKSYLWWHLSLWRIEHIARSIPEVESVSIVGSFWSPRTFLIHVKERIPRFVVPLGKEAALYAYDGSFLRIVDFDTFSETSDIRHLILIKFPQRLGSPDIVASRAKYLSDVAAHIEGSSPLPLVSLSLRDEYIGAHFAGLPFEVVFAKIAPHEISEVGRQTLRLSEVRAQLKTNEANVRRVDLSFPPNVYVKVINP